MRLTSRAVSGDGCRKALISARSTASAGCCRSAFVMTRAAIGVGAGGGTGGSRRSNGRTPSLRPSVAWGADASSNRLILFATFLLSVAYRPSIDNCHASWI